MWIVRIQNLFDDHSTSACDAVVPSQLLQLVVTMQRRVQPFGAMHQKRSPLNSTPWLRQRCLRNCREGGHGSPLQQQNCLFLPPGGRVKPSGAEMATCLQPVLWGTKAAFSAYLGNFLFPLLPSLSASSKLSLVLASLNLAAVLAWPSQFLNPATTDVCLLLLQFYLSSSSFCSLSLPAFTSILFFWVPNYRGGAALYDSTRTLWLLE